jgi:hypothetical protein
MSTTHTQNGGDGQGTGTAAGVADRARTGAADLAAQAREGLGEYAAAQREAGASAIHDVAKAAHSVADQMEQTRPEIARYARQAASAVDDVSEAIRSRSVGDIIRSIDGFARREPVAFFGTALLAGFAISRFLGSSSRAASSYGSSGDFDRMGDRYGSPDMRQGMHAGSSFGSDSLSRGGMQSGSSTGAGSGPMSPGSSGGSFGHDSRTAQGSGTGTGTQFRSAGGGGAVPGSTHATSGSGTSSGLGGTSSGTGGTSAGATGGSEFSRHTDHGAGIGATAGTTGPTGTGTSAAAGSTVPRPADSPVSTTPPSAATRVADAGPSTATRIGERDRTTMKPGDVGTPDQKH